MITAIADAAAMEELGGDLARECPPGLKIFLQGQLGAGKTTLVRGFLRALGHTGNVKSPTYTLVEPYQLEGLTLYHFDLYRLNGPEELENIGLRDYFDRASICLVEWPERGGRALGKADLWVEFAITDTGRKLTFKANTPAGLQVLASLNSTP